MIMKDKNINPVKTGKFIAKLRKSLHLTQEELGEIIYISRKSVSKWETGRCCPSIDMLKKLSEVLGATFDELIAGEFIDRKSDIMQNEPVFLKRNRSKWLKVGSICVGVVIVSIFLILFGMNLDDTTLYLFNSEDETFAITNGMISLTKERSNLYVGNFYSVANDIDKSTEFDITLYHKNDDEEENLIIGFNGQSSVQLGKDVRDQLKEILKKKDHNDLYLRVSYEDKEGSPRVHDLKLALLESDNISDEAMFSESTIMPLKNAADEEIDLSFLFDLDESVIKESLVNKKIKILGEEYKITYNDGTDCLNFTSNKNTILIYFGLVKLFINEEVLPFTENSIIKSAGIDSKDFELIKGLVDEVLNQL